MAFSQSYKLTLSALVLLTFVFSGCGKDEKEELTVTGPSTAFFLPNDISFNEFDPCYPSVTISHKRFTLPNITTTWSGKNSTYLPLVWEIKTDEVGGLAQINCNWSPASGEIATFLGHASTGMTEGASAVSSCPIHCGGVTIYNDDVPFVTTATLIIRGIKTELDSEGNSTGVQKQVTGRYTFSIENTP